MNKTKIGRVAEWLLRLSVKQIPNGAAGSNPAPPNFFVLPNAAPMSFHIKGNPPAHVSLAVLRKPKEEALRFR